MSSIFMALEGLELIIIAIVVVIFFIYGPKKIPELARALGMARRNMQRRQKAQFPPPARVKSPLMMCS